MSEIDPHLRQDLSPRQRKLLELMLKDRQAAAGGAGGGGGSRSMIARRPESAAAVLSFAQRRLWFLQQLRPTTAAYNIPSGVRLHGPLDVPLFQRALAATVERHETLRSTFVQTGDRPLQVLVPRLAVAMPLVDLQALPAGPREQETHRVVNGLARHPFAMAAAPPWRAVLVRAGALDHVFLVVMHHIISDTWTTGVFFREMTGHYRALVENRPARVPELPIQYGDYAHWQSRELEQEVGLMQRQLAYWRERFAGAPALLALPTDRPRPAVPSLRGGRVTVALPPALTDRLKGLAAATDATLFMILMAAYQTLLLRHTGQEDVLVGTPMANRTRVELENLIGVFVNTLVLRTDFAGNPTFRAVARQVREATLAGLSHHDVPFERVVEALQLQRDTSRNPLFQALFAFQNVPIPKLVAEGLTLARFEFEETTARLDLDLDLQEMPYGFVGWIGYNSDLFDAATMARWARGFLLLLEGLAADPDLPVWDLPLLAAEERHQTQIAWNDTAARFAQDDLLHRLLERQAGRTPHALAVTGGGGELTYAELDRRANQLARLLRAQGVLPGARVALHLARGPLAIVAVFGILKAGGTYVPLETSWPATRCEQIVELAGIRHLVSESARGEKVALLAPRMAHVTLLDAAVELDAQPTAPPRVVVPAASPAYTLFTSGSTGIPKGVMVGHRPVINLVEWVNRTFAMGPGDRLLWVTALSFDLSVYDIFGAAACGATLRIASEAEMRDPQALAAILLGEPVTFWSSAPAALQQVASLLPGTPCRQPLRLVFQSGDWIPVSLPDRVRATFPAARVIGLGGPTETVVWTNFYPIGEVPAWWPSIPYGRPIQNVRFHVLDGRLGRVPAGVQGDLHVSGECLSLGYLGDPELTARKYLPDPFGGEPGGRLYATGDRVRHLADGTLEFQGRLDHQVKIRGFRIELGEVETVLARHPAVRELALLVRTGGSAGPAGPAETPRLVAYIVPRPGPAPTVSELRDFLRERLPDYMVPAAFVTLEALPVTANGKLDRRALPPPDAAERPELGAEFADPEGETEGRIAALWRQVLGVARIGRNDNFFDLGGHSLLLSQVHRELQQTAPELTLVDMFTYPTIGALAAYLTASGGRPAAAAAARERAAARRLAAGGAAGGGQTDVAIVGMGLRFPGAESPEEFWRNLAAGVESIQFFSRDQVLAAGVAARDADHPDYVRAEGDIRNVDLFEPEFFGLTNQAEVEMLDPQQRIFMECAWEALESAGYDPHAYPGVIGIFGGVNISSYLFSNLYDYDPMNVMSSFLTRIGILVGNQSDYACTRIAYHFNLRGPSISVQTACSTATVAAHLAYQSLLRGECDMCLAGGAQIRVPQGMGYLYQEGGFPSPDGHCRSFDARAKGNVHGNGAGVVLLKRLADALRDGDHIHAVIKGSAACNDGSVKVGYTAPGVDGQVRAAAEALALAGVEPDSVGYIEATGAATELGDPIEVEALTRAYRTATGAPGSCPIGSVKSNIGHLDVASGAAALIKAALSLEHELIPPSLHFETPNPRIDFASSPFCVNSQARPWRRGATPRRAAVHTYAVGGTNTHLILEEAPPAAPAAASRRWQLLPLAARTTTALHRAGENLAAYLRGGAPAALPDVAHTLQVGRRPFAARRAVLCRDAAEAAAALSTLDPRRVWSALASDERRQAVFLLPGAAHLAAGAAAAAELYAAEPGFRAAIDQGAELLLPLLGTDLRPLLGCAVPAPDGGVARSDSGVPPSDSGVPPRDAALADPRFAEPASYLLAFALAQLWIEWGVAPAAVAGWGVGELAAACLAGTLSPADAARLAAARGRAVAACPPGARLEIEIAEADLAALLAGGMAVEAVPAPGRCRVVGPAAAIDALQERLNEQGIDCFHLGEGRSTGELPAAARADYRRALAEVTLRPAELPLWASPTGAPLGRDEAARIEVWERQLAAPARLGRAVTALAANRRQTLLVLGTAADAAGLDGIADPPELLGGSAASDMAAPLAVLGDAAAPQAAAATAAPGALAAAGPALAGTAQGRLLAVLARLWVAGVEVDWAGFSRHERRRRVPLPTYPFERRKIWAEPKIGRDQAIWRLGAGAAAGERRPVGEWFYAQSWRRSERPPLSSAVAAAALPAGVCLLFADALGVGDRFAEGLRAAGREVVVVRPGAAFAEDAAGGMRLNPRRFADYQRLLAALAAAGRQTALAVHLWGLDAAGAAAAGVDDLCFWSTLHLGRALGESAAGEVQLAVVAAGTQEVTGDERLAPGRAACLSACRVIPHEYPAVRCRSIDVVAPAPQAAGAAVLGEGASGAGGGAARLAAQLLGELAQPAAEPVAALRGSHLWVQQSERLEMTAGAAGATGAAAATGLRQGGVYLVAGGLQGFGLLAAEHLAQAAGARLALVGDTGLPPRETWDEWLAAAPTAAPAPAPSPSPSNIDGAAALADTGGDPTVRALRQIRRWEAAGCQVLLLDADLADRAQMQAAVAAVRARFGALHGVLYAAAEQDEELARPIAGLDQDFFDYRMRARLGGLLALADALPAGNGAGEPLDFVLLAGTVASLVGGPAVAADACADTFLDLFARQQSRRGGTPWTSLDWDAWQGAPGAGGGITAAEGALAFSQLLARPALPPQVVVSTVDLAARLPGGVAAGAAGAGQAGGAAAAAAATARERPPLRTSFVGPRSEVESQVAGIWAEVLGLREIGVEDDFFDLGGNSLLATQLVSRLRGALQINLALQDFFAGATVAAVAERAQVTRWSLQALAAPAAGTPQEMGEI